MAHIVERDGKAYLVEDNRIIAAADNPDDLLPPENVKDVIELGDRVEWSGMLGNVALFANTIYGRTATVRFDNGEYESMLAEDLKISTVEKPFSFESVAEEIGAEYEKYDALDPTTHDEIEEKLALARKLNLRAKALITDKHLPLSDQVKMNSLVVRTGADIVMLKSSSTDALLTKEAAYLESQPKYNIEIGPSTRFTREDISWVDLAADEMEALSASKDWDKELSHEASRLVEKLSKEEIEDLDFLRNLADATMRYTAAGLSPEDFNARTEQLARLLSTTGRMRILSMGGPLVPTGNPAYPSSPGTEPYPGTPGSPGPGQNDDMEEPDYDSQGRQMIFDAIQSAGADMHADGSITFYDEAGNEWEAKVNYLGQMEQDNFGPMGNEPGSDQEMMPSDISGEYYDRPEQQY